MADDPRPTLAIQAHPTSAEVLDRIRTATPDQVKALVRAYRRAMDPYADLMAKQFKAGEYATVKHRIVEDLELVRRWLGPEATAVMKEFEGALGNRAFVHGRDAPDIALDRTKRSNDRRLAISIGIPVSLFFVLAILALLGAGDWLYAPAFIALASFIPIMVVVSRLEPPSIQARAAFEGALLAARAQEVVVEKGDPPPLDVAGSPIAVSIDRLLRPYREAFEGLSPHVRRSTLDRVSAVLAVGGVMMTMAVIAIGAVGSGGRTFRPDAAWSLAFWGSLIVMFVGLGLAIVSRALGRSRRG